jgi:hypothetical protein
MPLLRRSEIWLGFSFGAWLLKMGERGLFQWFFRSFGRRRRRRLHGRTRRQGGSRYRWSRDDFPCLDYRERRPRAPAGGVIAKEFPADSSWTRVAATALTTAWHRAPT